MIREFFPQQEPNSNQDTCNRTENEETVFPELKESDEELISRLASNFSQDHKDELQECAGLSEESDFNRVRDKISNGCSCHFNCFDQFQYEEIKDHLLTMRALSRDEKDMYIMGKLKCKSTGIDTSDKKRQRYMYSFDDREVCKVAFLIMHDLGEKQLNNLLKHLKMNGPVPRNHGNKGRKPKHALSFLDIKRVVSFIIRYSEEYGLPLPAVPHGNASVETPVLLPASSTKIDIHTRYQSVCEESNERYHI